MLPTTNATVTIARLVETSGERAYSNVASGYRVYIQSTDDKIEQNFDGEGAYEVYIMMTNGVTAVQIGDRITDQNNKVYKVKGGQVFSDLTGKHGEYTLVSIYD